MSLLGDGKDADIIIKRVRSNIEPTDEEIRKKLKNAKKKPKDKIEFNDRAYESYIENGFPIDPEDSSDDHAYRTCYIRQQKLDFIARVDLSKGKFTREIFAIKRLKAPDYDEDGEPTRPKEWITYEEHWRGKNWLGKNLFVTNFEGVFDECTKVIETKFDPDTGEVHAEYVQGAFRSRYYIPFSKENVDSIFKKLGIDPKESDTRWYGQFRDSAKGSGFRCASYNYDQFVNTKWDEFEDLARREGGPNGVIPPWAPKRSQK